VANLLYGISKFPLIYVSSPPRGEDGGEGAKFLYGISKFPLTYVSSPLKGEGGVRGNLLYGISFF